MGILDQYKKQLEEDRKNENDNFSEDFNIEVDEDYKEQYKKELHKQRADIFDNEKQYTERINNTLVRLHEDEKSANLIKNEDVDRIIVKHFYCPECGKKIDVSIDLSELPVETLEEGYEDKLIVKLPNRGDTVYTKV